jgi:GAF domain-containing protein/two-component sensor histidine kinase
LSVQSELPHAWSKSTQRIIQTLANLIAVALRNAQLFKEISDSQAHLHAALEASKEITTARDPDEALQAIVGRVRQVTGAWRAFCAIVDDIGTIRRPASVGFDENLVEAHSIRSNGISRSVLRSKRARFIQDTHKAKDDVHPKMIEQGVKSAACLPMIYEDQVIGLLWTHYQNFHSFSEGEQEALRLYAMQAAIAFMNALQMRKLEHMRQAVETLSGAVGTQDVLHQIVQSARDVLHANSAAIWSYDDVSDKFIPEDCVAAGIPEDIWETFRREEPRTGQTAYTVIQRSWVGVQNVNETKTYPFLGASTRRLLKKLGVNSFQGVALLDGDEILGILYVNYNQLRSFSKDEQETAKTFANHAALALKKAKLLDQLEAARNAARVVAHVSAVGELHSTLDSIVEGTLEALGCDAVTLYTFDDEKNEFGFPPSIAGVKDEETVFSYGFVSRESILYRIIDTNKMYFSDDSQNDPILSGPFTRREKIISTAGVPLISRGRKVGMMFVNYRKRHRFTHDETTNIELFANQAAVAIHNAYLYDQEKRLAAALRALHNAGRAVSSTLNLDQILGHIAEHAYHLALPKGESTHFSYLSWVEDGKMQFKASYPRSRVNALKEALGDIDLEHDKRIGISGRVATSGHSMLVGNATRHSAITLLEDGIHSQLSVPISIDDQVVGVISVVDMANDAFDEEDMRALEALADQACLAIRNAHQYEEIKETRGLVGARTALAWMGMASSVWGHAIRINAQTIREQLSLLKGDLKAMKVDNSAFRERLSTIDHLAQNIQEKPLTTPLSVEEGTEAVNLNGLITERTRQLWRNDPYRIASLELKLKLNDDATVIVNREWLRRAFDVLVDNAVSAVEHCATKEITIGTDETNVGYCEMFIKDTGQGIPEHIQDKILKDPIEKPERDQGMGLLIAQTIVQTYGGEIKMKYTGGEGTCMMIRLPLES